MSYSWSDAPLIAGEVDVTSDEKHGPMAETLLNSVVADTNSVSMTGSETVRIAGQCPDIPNYSITRELGRGGMGVVYEAVQLKLNRRVALKLISTPDQIEVRTRFQIEAEAIARLQHPHIVQVYDFGEHEGTPYLSLELVNGGSLDQWTNGSALPPRDAAEIVEKIARGMNCAHQHGIIHRDLKPGNILLTVDGDPKVTDFGLAKELDRDLARTRSGEIMGTPHFMAPEQAGGALGRIGPATDIYSLGAVLYFLLTGEPPNQGQTILEVLEMVRTVDPIPPRRINPHVDRDLETVCLKCLRKEPERRYATAVELADDLQRFLEHEPVHARPISHGERVRRWIRRRPAVAGLSAAVLVITAASLAVLGMASRKVQESRQLANEWAEELVEDRALELEVPLGLPAFGIPIDNPLTHAKVELGRKLFFDKRLSLDNSVSCATCHNPVLGWSNGKPVAIGVGGQFGRRNPPTVVNAAVHRVLLWDGRAASLEEQALIPITDPSRMGMPSTAAAVEKLNRIEGYRKAFQHVFQTDVTAENLARALAAFERTILSGGTPYDRYQAGDRTALSPAAQRGMDIFFHSGHCSACHAGPNLTDGGFHNIGIGIEAHPQDQGRETISGLAGDRGSFRTPSLRDVARTAPYMHDGSFQTLEEVVDYYDRGGTSTPRLDEAIHPLNLSAQQKRDLIAFLQEGLSSPNYPYTDPPELPQ